MSHPQSALFSLYFETQAFRQIRFVFIVASIGSVEYTLEYNRVHKYITTLPFCTLIKSNLNKYFQFPYKLYVYILD